MRTFTKWHTALPPFCAPTYDYCTNLTSYFRTLSFLTYSSSSMDICRIFSRVFRNFVCTYLALEPHLFSLRIVLFLVFTDDGPPAVRSSKRSVIVIVDVARRKKNGQRSIIVINNSTRCNVLLASVLNRDKNERW